jgi:hypothetical protein
MTKRKKDPFVFKCSVCGLVPEPLRKTEGGWTIIENKPCVKCGGRLVFSPMLKENKVKE